SDFFFVRQEASPERGRDAQRRDQIRRDLRGRDSLRLATACQVEGRTFRSCQLLKDRLVLLPVLEVWNRNRDFSQTTARITLPKSNKTIGFSVWEWLQHHCVDDTENRGTCADAEPQCNHHR